MKIPTESNQMSPGTVLVSIFKIMRQTREQVCNLKLFYSTIVFGGVLIATDICLVFIYC